MLAADKTPTEQETLSLSADSGWHTGVACSRVNESLRSDRSTIPEYPHYIGNSSNHVIQCSSIKSKHLISQVLKHYLNRFWFYYNMKANRPEIKLEIFYLFTYLYKTALQT